MSGVVPAPPDALREPNTTVLRAGSTLDRVHLTEFGGAAFNPCRGRPTRFAPIFDGDGACVPSLYAGSSLDSAIYETIFHDVPATALFKTVPRQDVTARSHSVIETTRDVLLVSLRAPDLKKWGLSRAQLVSAPASDYAQTVLWAQAIHHRFPAVHGLVWTSNQCDPDSAFLFFGDRAPAAFRVVSTRHGHSDPSFIADVRAAGSRADIVITS